jgi:hypothetical protein
LFVRVSKWADKIHIWPAAVFLDAERSAKGRRGTLLFCISDLVASAAGGMSTMPADAGFAVRNAEENLVRATETRWSSRVGPAHACVGDK